MLNKAVIGIGAAVLAAGVSVVKLRHEGSQHVHQVLGGSEVAGACASERDYQTTIAALQDQIVQEHEKLLRARAQHIETMERRLNKGQEPGTYSVQFDDGEYKVTRNILGSFFGTGIDIPNQ